jgi:hypothetical protein
MEGKALKLRFSRVKAKHVAVLNRLSRILNEPPGNDYDLRKYLSTRDASLTLPTRKNISSVGISIQSIFIGGGVCVFFASFCSAIQARG